MKQFSNPPRACVALALVSLFILMRGSVSAAPEAIISKDAKIDNVQLHYLTAGHGPAVLLLHGYAETSRMWRPIIPLLAEKFTVIAPDLPGIGDSSIPTDKIDMISSASRIHALVRSLGIEKARVVGHDIGLMVAYAYATQFPAETEKLVVMDAFLPGVPGWEPIYNAPNVWHFRFNGEYPEALVKGRERTSSNISGTCLRPTRPARFRSRNGKPTLKRMRSRDGCARAGRTSLPGRNWRKISRNSRKRS